MLLPPSAVIYGAGGFGVRLAAALSEAGTKVVGFVDRSGNAPSGFPSLTLIEAAELGIPVFLGISSPGVNLAELIAQLSSAGVQKVVNPVQAALALHQLAIPLDNYWMTGEVQRYKDSEIQIQAASQALEDPRSKDIFEAVLLYRRNGVIAPAANPDPLEQQYLPRDVPFITDSMRFVDIGAFDGDTVRSIRSAGIDLDALMSLEPDPRSYLELAEEVRSLNLQDAVALPLALGDAIATLRFNANSSASASQDSEGSTYVQSVRFDDLAPSWRPTHIKMDVEGAEQSVLAGMESTLRSNQPALAISVYHIPEDHWSILNWVKSLDLGYSFYMRIYGYQTFDTVLYCIPQRSEV
jgi:FkbM family methyltransferase